ncbi:MAG: response regulator [Sulfurovum sp.]|jgi:DNA-binding response OmpR family regulator
MKLDRLKSKTILLVEDERIIRNNIVSMLKFFFKEVYTAIDGYDGLDQYEKYQPDVIMTDLKMPNMGGFELLEELKKRNTKSFNIIVSAHTDTDLLVNAINKGVNRYLIKPITEDELFEALEAYLDNLEINEPKLFRISESIEFNIDLNEINDLTNENEVISLNKKEGLLLKLLSSNDKKIFSYEEIEEQVWAGNFMSVSAIRSVVRDLRKKIGNDFIVNVSGSGYKLK